jgi:chorismate mutase
MTCAKRTDDCAVPLFITAAEGLAPGTDHSVNSFKWPSDDARGGRPEVSAQPPKNREETRQMVSPVTETSSAARNAQNTAESTLAELRDSVADIAKQVADIAEKRTRAARAAAVETAEAGASELRRNIRKQPVVAMAVAAAAGALLAIAFVPRFGRSAPVSRWDRWAPNMPNVTRADLYELADNIQRSVTRAANAAAAPVAPAFERMVEALSRTDSSAVSSLLEKAGGWFGKAKDKVEEKMR